VDMDLVSREQERIRTFYLESFLRHPLAPHQQVRWWTEDSQRIRFEVLARIGSLADASVLDVGAGLGDLCDFLADKTASYTGMDLLPEFVAEARRRHPGAEFIQAEFMGWPEDRQFDYVLASGTLSFRVPDHERFYFGMIAKMFRLAKRAAGFNMLRQGAHAEDGVHATYDPLRVAAFADTLSARVEVMTDYLPEDFTVFLYK
jgi:SAM-dependent methyltransferase